MDTRGLVGRMLREAGKAGAGATESAASRAPAMAWAAKVPRPSPEFPRSYVDPEADLSGWEGIKPYLDELRARSLPNRESLLKWIRDFAEVSDVVGEEGSRLYIAMTCFTQDEEKQKAYIRFVETVEPAMAPIIDELNRKIIAHPDAAGLPAAEYGQWIESLRTSIALYHERNIPLHTEITKLAQAYQQICGEMTVDWDGQTKTLSQLSPFLQSADRTLREKAWRKMAERRFLDRQRLDDLFDELFVLRNQVARTLGLKDYVEYAFKAYHRTDYSPADCHEFHKSVENAVVPVYRKALAHRREKLGLESLRPWDLGCDALGRPPLKPFSEPARLVEGVDRIFSRLDPELHGFYRTMTDLGLMDLENRVGKAPGGYQCGLSEVRLPFIFMNSVGLNEDVFTLLHESGHAFHLMYTRPMTLGFNRGAPMEFSEVASMAMERLGSKYLQEFYGPEDHKRAVQQEDEEVFRLLPWVATVDAFQHWLYTHPGHTQAQRRAAWLDLDRRFGPQLDWSGIEEFQANSWQRQLHIFEVPFYYIEYGIAQLGALQVWLKSLADEKTALADYKRGLKLGGTRRLKDLFEGAGLRFDLRESAIRPLVDKVREEWEAAVTDGTK
ncbi:MAG TPA: M3 family oligoendopeptidase [Fibrobacteria bacterium]|nr:M3 family oligoendopeptidase [Fibrobacteria bacterium]